MSTILRATITALIEATYKNVLDLSTPIDELAERIKIQLSNGTGANSADLMFHDRRTLSASGTEDLDLAGSLAGPFGASQVFAEVRGILIAALSTNTNNVNLTRPASNGVPLFLAASDGIPIPPGGVFLWSCPADGKVPVTASTGDLLTVTNASSGTSVTYDVVIIGTSA